MTYVDHDVSLRAYTMLARGASKHGARRHHVRQVVNLGSDRRDLVHVPELGAGDAGPTKELGVRIAGRLARHAEEPSGIENAQWFLRAQQPRELFGRDEQRR